jgi:lipoyl(octanoyl) transferase
MRVVDLGLVSYEAARLRQLEAHADVLSGGANTLFLLEHEPVITVGRHGGMEHLRVPPGILEDRGVVLAEAERGGSITCHYPGQLVFYPIFRVDRRPGGLKAFFRDLEEVVIRSLSAYGVPSFRMEGRPGVWVESGKIASIGIAVKRWVTYHGVALNVASDTSLFDLITLCGISDARAATLESETGHAPPMQELKQLVADEFRTVFQET